MGVCSTKCVRKWLFKKENISVFSLGKGRQMRWGVTARGNELAYYAINEYMLLWVTSDGIYIENFSAYIPSQVNHDHS